MDGTGEHQRNCRPTRTPAPLTTPQVSFSPWAKCTNKQAWRQPAASSFPTTRTSDQSCTSNMLPPAHTFPKLPFPITRTILKLSSPTFLFASAAAGAGGPPDPAPLAPLDPLEPAPPPPPTPAASDRLPEAEGGPRVPRPGPPTRPWPLALVEWRLSVAVHASPELADPASAGRREGGEGRVEWSRGGDDGYDTG